jgi:hypothetical protein
MMLNVFTMRKPWLLSLGAAFVAICIAVWGATSPRKTHDGMLQQPELCKHVETSRASYNSSFFEDATVLFVLDPNCPLCFEEVGIDEYTNQTLLPWIRGLKDALTATADNPEGLDLEVIAELVG